MKRVIVVHGKNKMPLDIWYPYLKKGCEKVGIACSVPNMGQEDVPKIEHWLEIISDLKPDQETVLVGHSRGGMAILRWLEKSNRPVKKVILVAANNPNFIDEAGGDFYGEDYNYEKIKSNCSDFVVIHSGDDVWVPFKAAQENARNLDARKIYFEDKNHFGEQADGTMMTEFPELLEEFLQ